MGFRELRAVVVVNLLVLAGSLALLESAARLLTDSYSDEREFRLSRPPPYRDASFFSADFIEESFAQPGGWQRLPGLNAIVPRDFRGDHFTVESCVRRTTDVPPYPTATVYLFGGSTIYNSEVPDDETVASHLQRRLVGAGLTDYRVVNLGVTSVSTTQQLERLRVTPIEAGDIVVFYDGVNDVLQGVLYGNPGSTIYGNDRSRPLWQKIVYRLAKKSVAVRHLLRELNANYRILDLDARVRATVARYRDNVARAKDFATSRGARFAHFLQPNLYTLAHRGEYEERLLTYGFVPSQAEEAFIATYPHFAALIGAAATQGAAAFDLQSIFDSTSEPVYLDGWHVNHRGNSRIADAISARLLAGLGDRPEQSMRSEQSPVAGRMHSAPHERRQAHDDALLPARDLCGGAVTASAPASAR